MYRRVSDLWVQTVRMAGPQSLMRDDILPPCRAIGYVSSFFSCWPRHVKNSEHCALTRFTLL